MPRQLIKKLNWNNLIVMAMCGVGFYFIFNDLIEKNDKADLPKGTYFMIEIIADGMSPVNKSTAMESTLPIFKKRMDEINIPGTKVYQEGINQILIHMPKVVDEREAAGIKKILVKQEHIKYKLVVFGPVNR